MFIFKIYFFLIIIINHTNKCFSNSGLINPEWDGVYRRIFNVYIDFGVWYIYNIISFHHQAHVYNCLLYLFLAQDYQEHFMRYIFLMTCFRWNPKPRMSSQVISTDNATVFIQINAQVVEDSTEREEKQGLYNNEVLKGFLKRQPKALGVFFSTLYSNILKFMVTWLKSWTFLFKDV